MKTRLFRTVVISTTLLTAACGDDDSAPEAATDADGSGSNTDGPTTGVTTDVSTTAEETETGASSTSSTTGSTTTAGSETEGETDAGTDSGTGGDSNVIEVDIIDNAATDFTDVYLTLILERQGAEFVFDKKLGDAALALFRTTTGVMTTVPVAGPGSVPVELVEPPADALYSLTCADVNLGRSDGQPMAFCDADGIEGDLYGGGKFVLFRDLNGNGQFDKVDNAADAFVDEVLSIGIEPFPRIIYVEKMESQSVRRSSMGGGFGLWVDGDVALTEPGWHIVEGYAPDDPELCDQLFVEQQDGCNVEETACADAGGSSADCFEVFMECMHVPNAARLDNCGQAVDPPSIEWNYPIEDPISLGTTLTSCDPVLIPFFASCDVPDVPPVGAMCSGDGSSYFFSAEVQYSPEEICVDAHTCDGFVELPVDVAPADWPCDVLVGLLGASCGGDDDLPCHSQLTCTNGTCGD